MRPWTSWRQLWPQCSKKRSPLTSSRRPSPMSKKSILIVEDDADVRLGYNVLLRANHYDTRFAADSLTAVSEARKHQPDLIIRDLGLPAGDGFVVLERFRGIPNLAVVPVIVVSARDL